MGGFLVYTETMMLQVGVKVVLMNPDGKVLLLKRSMEKYGNTDGVWDIPGGRIDAGVPLLENLAREVREETSLELSSIPRLIAAQDILRGEEKHVVRLTYTATAEGEVVLDTSENSEYVWVPLEELIRPSDDSSIDVYLRTLLADGILTKSSWI